MRRFLGRASQKKLSLLSEIASYEEPRVFLDDSPTLADLARNAGKPQTTTPLSPHQRTNAKESKEKTVIMLKHEEGNIERQDSILAIIKDKGTVFIKDISTVIRGVSEKTIQRELKRLVKEGKIRKTGNRRWTSYSIAEAVF
jgi:DeoR-like helix-turn-helix domain